MAKVLFICLGNICRSPMAEGLFAHKIAQLGLSEHFSTDSAGMGSWHEGELADARTRAVAQTYGFTLPTRARQIRPRDVSESAYLVAMDESVRQAVAKMMAGRNTSAKLVLMREFDPLAKAPDLDVPDPYNGEKSDFEIVYQMLDRSLDTFINHLKTERGL